MMRRNRIFLFFLFGVTGLVCFSKGLYIHAKAGLAQHLLQSAWQDTLAGESNVKPWLWADTWPIAQLQVPSMGINQIILEGASGSSLAFAPGHLQGTPLPGQAGYSIISAHRDTHFRFLKRVSPGERITIQTADRKVVVFRVTYSEIINKNHAMIPVTGLQRGLVLVTCYPFDAIRSGGDLRYLVYAVEVAGKGGEKREYEDVGI